MNRDDDPVANDFVDVNLLLTKGEVELLLDLVSFCNGDSQLSGEQINLLQEKLEIMLNSDTFTVRLGVT